MHRSVAGIGILALLLGIFTGASLLVPVVIGGPLGAALVLAFGAILFSAWGSGAGADLHTNLQIGVVHASGVVIGSTLFVVLGGIESEFLAFLIGIAFAIVVSFSFVTAVCFALLQGCAKRGDEVRRHRIRGAAHRRAQHLPVRGG
jgi:hypothetical protein